MNRVGIDTCVVLRLLVGEPPQQAQAAKSFVDECYFDGVEACVSDLVVAEVYHALIHHYEVPRKEVISVLTDFLTASQISTTGHALAVLKAYEEKGPGFVDRLIRMDFLDDAPEIKTFDQDFAKLDNVTLLNV